MESTDPYDICYLVRHHKLNPDPRLAHLVFNNDRRPYFKDESEEIIQAVKYFKEHRLSIQCDQVDFKKKTFGWD